MFDKILDSCKYVMNNSVHVKINYDVLDKFTKTVNCNDLKYWLSGNLYNLFDLDISTIINFMLLFEAIDYSFWGTPKWSINTEFGIKDGSDALFYTMLNYVKKVKTTDFSKINLSEFKELLHGNVEIPLLEDRYQTLVDISRIVNDKMNGNFYQYIYDIKNDLDLFSIIIDNFPSFRDEREYNGQKIYFYKLAQLLVSDILHLREQLEKINVDYSHLVGCSDYKIPQVLRELGIIEYDEELSLFVDNKIELKCSSKYEVEIRASVILVINYINNCLSSTNKIDINDYFFLLARRMLSMKPYHLCRNTNY